MNNNTKISEGHLTAMITASSVLLGFSFFFFREWNSGSEEWAFPEDLRGLIPLSLCALAFLFTILISLYPKQPTLKRLFFAWYILFAGIISLIYLAVISAKLL